MAMTMGNNGRGPNADMNVTPLIDVLLVLLIIFMIITPTKPYGLEALIPQSPKGVTLPTNEPRTVVIQLLPSDAGLPALKINSEDIAWTDLQPRLTAIFKQRAERVAFVMAGEGMEFEFVARVVDAAHASGIDRVGLLPDRAQGT